MEYFENRYQQQPVAPKQETKPAVAAKPTSKKMSSGQIALIVFGVVAVCGLAYIGLKDHNKTTTPAMTMYYF